MCVILILLNLFFNFLFVTFANYSVLGAILIVGGLYTVLWGKSKDIKMIIQSVPTSFEEECSESLEIVTTPSDDKAN